MDQIAIDLGGRESQICVRSADGEILEETRWPTVSLKKYLERRPPSRVLVESCAEAFAIAEQARQIGHEAVVVPAQLARALGVGSRGIKNDVRDARNLSESACRMARLPQVHVPTQQSRARKSQCGMRDTIIAMRTAAINATRGWVRTQGLGCVKSGAPTTLPRRVRMHVAAKTGEAQLPGYVERMLRVIEQLNEHIAEADEEVETEAAKDPVCQRLMTAPGVGPVTAVRFAAVVDQVERFNNAHSLEAYLGLTPGEHSSSERKRITGITKAGSAKMRWTLVQAAWVARRFRKDDPMVQWSRDVEQRRGKKIAIIALTRKLAGVLYAMWRDGTAYDPAHSPS